MLLMMALAVSSNFNCFWRGSMFKMFFSEERAWNKERKRGYTFARFLFTATPRHKRLARKKIPRTGQRTELACPLNGAFDDFFNHFFL